MKRMHQPLAVVTLHTLAALLLLLTIYVRQLPATPTPLPEPGNAENSWWGLWPVTYLPTWIYLLGVAGVGLALVVSWIMPHGPEAPRRQWSTASCRSGLTVLLLAWVGAFYAFPIVHTRWGDAYILTKAMAHADPAVRLTHSWQAPLDVLLHSQLWRLLHAPLGWADAMPVYHLLSPLAGLLYLLAALAVSQLGNRLWATPPWLTFALLTSIGVMQLFFGYIENYSFAAAGILIYLGLGLAALVGRRPLWWAALALALTNALHPSTIVYGLSLLYLGGQVARQRNQSWSTSVYPIALPMITVALVTIGVMEWGGHGVLTLFTTDRPGGGDARWLVPLWATSTRWERYTMFSWAHVRDLLNEQLLVAPMIGPALVVVALAWRSYRGQQPVAQTAICRPALIFLALATGAHLLLTWLWNPDYGGQRDWDLFSLAAIPLALLTAQLLARAFANRRALLAGIIPLLVLQYMLLAAWVYQNTLPWAWP